MRNDHILDTWAIDPSPSLTSVAMQHADQSLLVASNALTKGGRLNDIVMTLARIAAGREVKEEDIRALSNAASILDEVEQGYSWVDNPIVSSESPSYAESFDTAVRSWAPIATSMHFLDDIKHMRAVLADLLGGEQSDPKEIAQLREFFGSVFRFTIEFVDSLRSPTLITGEIAWPSEGL